MISECYNWLTLFNKPHRSGDDAHPLLTERISKPLSDDSPRRHFSRRSRLGESRNHVESHSEVVREFHGYSETRFACHWLGQCSLRDLDNRFSSGTQNDTDNLFLYKSLVVFRSVEVREPNATYFGHSR